MGSYRFTASESDGFIVNGQTINTDGLFMICWVKSVDDSTNQCAMCCADESAANDYVYLALRGDIADDPVRTRLIAGSGAHAVNNDLVSVFTQDTWHLIAAKCGANSQTTYADGTDSTPDTEADWPSGLDSLSVGVFHRNSDAAYMDGWISRAAFCETLPTVNQFRQLLVGEQFHDIPGMPDVYAYLALDEASYPSTNDIGGEFTNSGAAWDATETPTTLTVPVVTDSTPWTADDTTIAAFRADQHGYFRTVTLPAGRVSVLGVFARADDGHACTFYIEGASGGQTSTARTIDDDILQNMDGLTYFADGAVFDVATAGEYVVGATGFASGGSDIEGFQVASNAMEQATATHCGPRVVSFDGAVWDVRAEDLTGDIYVYKDGVQQEKVFDSPATNYNGMYHTSCAIQTVQDFLVVTSRFSGESHISVKKSDTGGDFSGATERDISGGEYSYHYLHEMEDGQLLLDVRGDQTGAARRSTIYQTTNIEDIDSEAMTYTSDTWQSDFNRLYPRPSHKLTDGGGNELYILSGSNRNSGSPADQQEVVACIYDPNAGSVGEFYSLNGDDANTQGSRGTTGTPRFSSSQCSTLTSAGDGIVILGANGSGQQFYPPGSFAKITSWPSGGSNPKGALAFMVAQNDDTSFLEYADTDVRWVSQNEGTLTITDATDFATELGLSGTNSGRIPCVFVPSGDTAGSDNGTVIMTDRGADTPTDSWGDDTPNYYSWGSPDVISFTVIDAFDPSPTFGTPSAFATGTGATIQGMDYLPGGNVYLRDALEEFHPTHSHYKQTLVTFNTSVGGGETPTQLRSLLMLGAI